MMFSNPWFRVQTPLGPPSLPAVAPLPQPDPSTTFLHRVLLSVGITGGLLVIGLLLWTAPQVLLLAFAGILVAIFLRSLSDGLRHLTGLREGWCLALVIIALAGITVGASILIAPSVGRQVDQLAEEPPRSFARVTAQLEQFGWGKWLLAQGSSASHESSGLRQAATALRAVLGVGANLLVVGFLGIYFASQPRMYLTGMLYLVPQNRRDRMSEVCDEIGYELRWWLLGQVFAMLLIGTLTTIGLWLLGIPLALILGIIAGLLNFVPNFGPWIAAVPGVLLAFSSSPTTGLYVIAVYAGVQTLERYCITPMVQQRTVHLPPAATILAQVLMGILLGVLGLAMATPLLVVVLVVIKMLYVEDVIGERMRLPGRDRAGAGKRTIC